MSQTLTRRGFISALAAAGAVIAGRPAQAFLEIKGDLFVLSDRTLILDRPLILDHAGDVLISHCKIEPSQIFPKGESLIVLSCENARIENCEFNTKGTAGHAIDLKAYRIG